MRDRDNTTRPNATVTLRDSLKRVGKTQNEAAALMGVPKMHVSNTILMEKKLTPRFVDLWCTLVEPRSDNILRRHLNYLGAASEANPLRGRLSYPDDTDKKESTNAEGWDLRNAPEGDNPLDAGSTITQVLRSSLKRSGAGQNAAARVFGMSKCHMSDVISMKRRMTPEFVRMWCRAIEPRDDKLLFHRLNYLGAVADGWDLRMDIVKDDTHG